MRRIKRSIGSSTARCVRCHELATLTVWEHRYARRWSDLLTTRFDAGAIRTATCSACSTTYPVRSTDGTAVAAAARVRRDVSEIPLARDWRHTEIQV